MVAVWSAVRPGSANQPTSRPLTAQVPTSGAALRKGLSMPRTLMPTPEDPQPPPSARPRDRLPPDGLLDPEGQTVLDFLRREYAAAPTVEPDASLHPAQPEPTGREPTSLGPARPPGGRPVRRRWLCRDLRPRRRLPPLRHRAGHSSHPQDAVATQS